VFVRRISSSEPDSAISAAPQQRSSHCGARRRVDELRQQRAAA
jgi:hypothetical protein